MLHARPLGPFSWNYRIFDDETPVAVTERSWFREAGHLLLEEAAYTVTREKLLGGRFLLACDDRVVASAEKPSAFRRRFEIDFAGERYVLRPASWASRRYVLCQNDRPVGSIRPARPFSRRALADLPETLPLAFRVFVLWLVLLMWKRAADQAGGA
ncbi:hypothetical protein GQ464_014325 [Rhodocaloribacter litoris]|uniref:hypothetical protein n=1 Tax=Rhodocaloribacter litoris TaxID=2558931 RepID=UPI001420CB9C|nr:hypothetical protein [Rhodocaloribacter litoris]QXD14595.1 hypothetical protein GQ464_014325 [Rhodocaloribacter litoris]GIV59635.1 MAG: hypothetical protein KatS3mg043_0724 [Rhodothermaceae bacterium]